jgi:RiboL-PSP-HEPN
MKTIEEVFISFGISYTKFDPRQRATVDELVEKRNSVAHGRESAAEIGERHRVKILREKMDIITNLTYYIIDEFEIYFLGKKFIRPNVRKLYK